MTQDATAAGAAAQKDVEPRPLVFFTGGTAMRKLSHTLACRTSKTVHIVTTFDSGGSTARLRKAFAMPAVGDLRNRLLALADVQACGEAIVRCMDTRLPDEGDAETLRQMLSAMSSPDHTVWQGVGELPRHTLLHCLSAFLRAMPADFDARQASLGNICMAGKYLLDGRTLASVLPLYGRLLHVRGQVVPIVEDSFHLAARLEDGTILVGQHLFKDLSCPIEDIFLTVYEPGRKNNEPVPCRPRASSAALAKLREASLVCYPMGSFYSSVLANLLADGVGSCVAGLACPKVFIPNTGSDRELAGHSVEKQLLVLLSVLASDCRSTKPSHLVSHILVDSRHGAYQGSLSELRSLAKTMDIEVLDVPIVRADQTGHDAAAAADVLMQLAGSGPAKALDNSLQ